MVFHDDDLERMTRVSGKLGDRTAADLAELRLKGGDERIPTLSETLALVGRRAMVHVELKTPYGHVGPLEQRTHEILIDHVGPVPQDHVKVVAQDGKVQQVNAEATC